MFTGHIDAEFTNITMEKEYAVHDTTNDVTKNLE
jgi:hypothetical protein